MKNYNKPIFKKFQKEKVCSSFTESILGADLVDMELISKSNKEIRFCDVLLIFSVNTHGLFL